VGVGVAQALFNEIYENYDISRDEIPYRLEAFSSLLETAFGINPARILEKAIAKKLYRKISLEYVEGSDKQLTDYVADAIETLNRRESTP